MLLLRQAQVGREPIETEVHLAGNHINFGRANDCTYQLHGSAAVSRVQATLRKVNDVWEIADGSSHKASSNGISLLGNRITCHQIKIGDIVTLFDSGEYTVTLEVLSTKEKLFVSSDDQTVEVPLCMQQQMNSLRDSMESIAVGVAGISLLGQSIEQIGIQVNSIASRVDEIESELTTMIKPRIKAQSLKDERQDKLIGKVLVGFGAAVVTLAGYSLSNGKTEGIDRALSIFQMLIGGGAVTMSIASKKPQEELSMETESFSEVLC